LLEDQHGVISARTETLVDRDAVPSGP
jgi:hypothetical protein